MFGAAALQCCGCHACCGGVGCRAPDGSGDCGQSKCLSTCLGCCRAGQCVPPGSQSDCACGAPGLSCDACPEGTECLGGWCGTSDDQCAYGLALEYSNSTAPLLFGMFDTFEGTGSQSQTCTDLLSRSTNVAVFHGSSGHNGIGADIGILFDMKALPLGQPVSFNNLAAGDIALCVTRCDLQSGVCADTFWGVGPNAPGTLLVEKDAPGGRAAAFSGYTAERYRVQATGTLLRDGTNAGDTVVLRVTGFAYLIVMP